jgi:hypothetical protein
MSEMGFEKAGRAPHAVLGDFHLPLWRRRQMRGPIEIAERQRDRRYSAGQTRQSRMKRVVGLIGLRLLLRLGFGLCSG